MKRTRTGYAGYALAVLVILMSLVAWTISAKAQNCRMHASGDRVCDQGASSEPPPAQAPKQEADTAAENSSNPLGEGTPLFSDDDTPLSGDNSAQILDQVLKSLPEEVQMAITQEALDFYEQNTDPAKRKELLTKLISLSKKIRELSNSACGLADSAQKNDFIALINNSIAGSIQFSEISASTPEQLNKKLDTLAQSICSKINPDIPPPPPGRGDPGFVSTDDNIESHDLGSNSDSGQQTQIPQGARSSDYAPGSQEQQFASSMEEMDLPHVEGKGGEAIAQCAKKMVGYVTSGIKGTQGGNLACAAAVSKMLQCKGMEKYSVGFHLSTVTLYDALKKDKCYAMVDTGHVDGFALKPGDILVTKRASRAGHTGIYVGDGRIVHNNSKPGVIRDNSNVTKWRSVTGRNPGGSAVFRRNCE